MNNPPANRSSAATDLAVRQAEVADAETIGQLLHDFNSEFDEPTPARSKLPAASEISSPPRR